MALAALLVVLVCASCSAAEPAERSESDGDAAASTAALATSSTTAAPSTSTSSTTTTTAAPTTTSTPPKAAVAPVFPPSPTPPRPVDASSPLRIHALGDSTAFTLGWGVSKAVTPTGLGSVTIDARTSTGLTRVDYFDWPTHLLGLAAAPPEVAVVSFGANDSQPLTRPDGSIVAFGAPGWSDEYARRVEGVVAFLTGLGAQVYWVGQPIARDPGYSERMRVLDDVYRGVVERFPDATYVDAWYWMSGDDGGYTDALPEADGAPVALRDDDGIHLSPAGGDFLGAVVANQIFADHGIAR